MKAAMHVYERHLFFKNALMELGIDENQAEDEACAIEHDISDDTFRRIQARVQELRGEQ